MLQEVGKEAVLSDVGLESGGVDDVVGRDLEQAVGSLDPGDCSLGLSWDDGVDLAHHGLVPTLTTTTGQLLLPQLASRGVGPTDHLVEIGSVLTLEPAHA